MGKNDRFRHQVSWKRYLETLEPDDRGNVQDVCGRLKRLSKERNLPLAVVAVGSVLNPASRVGNGSYNDIDLVLVPLLHSDLRRFEGVLSRFIKKQPETERQQEGLGRAIRRSSWRRSLKAASLGLPARLRELTHWYQISIFWNLKFASGKPVQLFVRTLEHRKTLQGMIELEKSGPDEDRFSRLVLSL